MKTNYLRFAILFLLSGLFFACSDDKEEPEVQFYVEPVKELLSPANGYSLELTSEAKDGIIFEWKKANVSSGVVPVYEVVFAKEGGDLNNPIEKIKSENSGKNNKVTMTHRQLDQIAQKAGIAEGGQGTLVWAVNTSSGSKKVISDKSHKITLTRVAPFVVPEKLYITGEGTEAGASVAGALEFTKLAAGKFEIFTKLEAIRKLQIIDSKDEKALRKFYVKAGKIEEGSTEFTVQKPAVYRMTVDFNTGTVSYVEVNNLRLIFCINESMIVNLKYDGYGLWKSEPAYMLLPNEWWGKEDRYKFKMNVTNGYNSSDLVWGTKIETDGRPNGQESYYYIKESFSSDIWADKWKLKAEYDKKGIVVTVSLQGGKEYTHSIEIVPLSLDWESIADKGTATLANNFWNSSAKHFYNNIKGQMRPYDYWPEAHAMDVIIDAYERTNSATYKQRISDFYDGIKAKNGGGFYNNYYDDMAWHGLTHMRAFKATGDTRYEESARDLWGWLTDGWNDEDGGGIPWNHENNANGKGKGVPTNGPSTIIAIRRWVEYGALEVKKEENNLQWAKKLYAWIRGHRYEPETGRVFEKKDDKGGDWTYNAGTFMGAAMELYDVTGEQSYFNDAMLIAEYGMENLSSNFYVLSDWAEQYNEKEDADHDVNLFKAIFVRYFTRLIMHDDLPADKRKQYINFLEESAKCLWTRATLTSGNATLFGHRWWEYPKGDHAIQLRTQTSGAAIMEAMALLQKKGYLN